MFFICGEGVKIKILGMTPPLLDVPAYAESFKYSKFTMTTDECNLNQTATTNSGSRTTQFTKKIICRGRL